MPSRSESKRHPSTQRSPHSFVADTLKHIGRDMRGKQVDENDVEEQVSTGVPDSY